MRTKARVGLFPVYRDNPFLNMLYLSARARGWDPRETSTLEGAESILRNLHRGDFFHMQWTAPVVQRADSEEEAVARRLRFEAAVRGAQDRGVSLVWTVHNVLPHDARWHEQELLLCNFLAQRADWVHIMSPATAAMTETLYPLPPEKLVQLPHPSYRGMYPPLPDRDAARGELGVRSTGRAVLFFGQMRPYKGLETLLRAVSDTNSLVDDAHRITLLLAGRTSDEDRARLEELLPPETEVVRDHGFIPDREVPRWFAAADVAVFPYQQILNSGSINLAATFGVPVIVPGEDHLRTEFSGQKWVTFFTPGSSSSLAEALRDNRSSDEAKSGALTYSRDRVPFTVSNAWADHLDAMLAEVGRRAV